MHTEIKRKRGRPRLELEDKFVRFAGVDWNERDFKIALEIGCSRERVRQVREALGKPKVRLTGHDGLKFAEQNSRFADKWLKENRADIAGKECQGSPPDYEQLWAELSTLYFLSLTKGKFAVIDAANAHLVSRHKWTECGGYAFRFDGKRPDGSRNRVNLHHVILPPSAGLVIDHRNGRGTDNRRNNLREATQTQNLQNQVARAGSQFKGVYKSSKGKSLGYEVQMRIDGKVTYIGYRRTAIEAARLYDLHALKHRGEFAVLNCPELINEYREALGAVFAEAVA